VNVIQVPRGVPTGLSTARGQLAVGPAPGRHHGSVTNLDPPRGQLLEQALTVLDDARAALAAPVADVRAAAIDALARIRVAESALGDLLHAAWSPESGSV
jgi:hypothetical protein